MNKKKFITELSNKLNYDIDKCTIINSIIEDNFIIGKKRKTNIVNSLIEQLNINEEEADNIYNVSSEIISTAIKNKIKHPFK